MPEPAKTFDVVDEEHEARAIAKARASIADGKGVPHDRVREWLDELAKGKRSPPPQA